MYNPDINVSIGSSRKSEITLPTNYSDYAVPSFGFEELQLVRLVGKGEVSYGFEAILQKNRTVMAKIATNRDLFFSNVEIDLLQRLKAPPSTPSIPNLHGAIQSIMPNPFRIYNATHLQTTLGILESDANSLLRARKISVIVVDYLRGKQPLPATMSGIRTYMQSLLETLQFAHSRNVMHLDLHVGNIFWDGNTAMLFDWNAGRIFTPGIPQKIGNRVAPEAKRNNHDTAVHASVSAFDIYTAGKLLQQRLLKSCCIKPGFDDVAQNDMDLAYNLAEVLMTSDPYLRPDAAMALKHPFFLGK
jgi:serine/threonine protein kinase